MLAPFPLDIWEEDQGLYKYDQPPTEQRGLEEGGSLERGIDQKEKERKVGELPVAVHRASQEQTLARLFFLVLCIIISPRGNPPHHTLE